MIWAVRRLVCGILLALVAAEGGRLSTVDALVFHEGSADPDGFRAHFEASSGCHEDVLDALHGARIPAHPTACDPVPFRRAA